MAGLYHEVCRLFPEMADDELDALIDDIRENGLREPIVRHNGRIVDGRNRHKACLVAQVEPRFIEWDGSGSLVEFVWGKNFHRRHLNPSQIAAIAAEKAVALEREDAERAKKTSVPIGMEVPEAPNPAHRPPKNRDEQVAKESGVPVRSTKRARRVLEKAPEIHEGVKSGSVRLGAADKYVAEVATPEPEPPAHLDAETEQFCRDLEVWRDEFAKTKGAKFFDLSVIASLIDKLVKYVRTGRRSGPAVTVADCAIPKELDTQAVRESLHKWLVYKRTVRKPAYKTVKGVESELAVWVKHGPEAFCAAVELATRKLWAGLVEPKTNDNGKRIGAGQRYDPGARERDPNHGKL